MNEKMTTTELAEIDARANAASEGPWAGIENVGVHSPSELIFQTVSINANDATFIASARTDVPALVARVRELEAELNELWARYKKLDEEDDNLREALAGAMDRW